MGQDPAAIRQEIEETRGELGETMEAIGYKTDVRARADDFVSEKKDKVTGKVAGAKDTCHLDGVPRRPEPRGHQAEVAEPRGHSSEQSDRHGGRRRRRRLPGRDADSVDPRRRRTGRRDRRSRQGPGLRDRPRGPRTRQRGCAGGERTRQSKPCASEGARRHRSSRPTCGATRKTPPRRLPAPAISPGRS